MHRPLLFTLAAVAGAALAIAAGAIAMRPHWSEAELKRIQSLSLASLPELPADPSNRVSTDADAAALGKALFFDKRFSANGQVSCASCHDPDRQFQDGLPTGHGIGTGARRTMPIAGTAYAPFLFWDGRKDSQWSQALGPFENPAEHGADRAMVVRLVAASYRAPYEALFGQLPDLAGIPAHAAPAGSDAAVAAWQALPPAAQDTINAVYANTGKAIAAFERTLAPQRTRFDAYAAALAAGDEAAASKLFTPAERDGLRLFIGPANCVSCHNGPLLTDNGFHNLGLAEPGGQPAPGRSAAVQVLKADPFNCLGRFSDAEAAQCTELRFMETTSPDLVGAFKSPSLRGVAERPPYMHAGQFATLREVLAHYNQAPAAALGRSELKPLALGDRELSDLEAFIRTLNVGDVPAQQVTP